MEKTSEFYDTTLEGVISFMNDRDDGFKYLVFRDLLGAQVTVHLTNDAVSELVEKIKAGPIPYAHETGI